METIIAHWDSMKIIQRIMDHKLIYIETKDVVETTLALDNYKRACDCGRGAIFLSVSRGKVAEGVDFDRHYGRCVILMGIPYRYTQSHALLARLQYVRTQYNVRNRVYVGLLGYDVLVYLVFWSYIVKLSSCRVYPQYVIYTA